MNRRATVLAPAALAAALLVVGSSSAGPEKIAFPAKWESFVLYSTLDRHDNKQFDQGKTFFAFHDVLLAKVWRV